MPNFFDEFQIDETPEGTDEEHNEYRKQVLRAKEKRVRKNRQDAQNEVGVAPAITEDIIQKRQAYADDFVLMHKEVYPESTGVKNFGKVQINSIYMGQDVFKSGGRLLKLEPRGYAKTTRITNEALYAVLAGMQRYIVIVCSNVQKAMEIVDSMKTELMENDKLLELFPGTISCFRHLDNNPMKSRFQTYGGRPTYIKYEKTTIRFPIVPDEPSAGMHIEIRPLTNLKGLNHKIKAGPFKGQVIRPTLVIFDDPQTYEEASSEPERRKIIRLIKRDALKGGSVSRRVSAIMAITPVCYGDVAYHFEKVEHSWDVIKYRMVEKFPDAHDVWMNDYARIYLSYDRFLRGDRARAALEAKKYVEDNYEMLHAGSEVSWEHAFGWDEEIVTEVSALQHAYNIILDDGMEDFEYECQCNTEYGLYDESETIHAKEETIANRTLPFSRRKVPQGTSKLVTHIDVNKDVLSYVTMAVADPFRGHIIEYGTHPNQVGKWSKKGPLTPLKSLYPNVSDYREVLYLAVKDLLQTLGHRPYLREDGVEVFNHAIGVDVKYEEDFIVRAIKDCGLNNRIVPCWGIYVGPDEELLHERRWAEGTRVYLNCVEKPATSRTIDYLNIDTNFFKTEVHKGFNQLPGLGGSITFYSQEPNGPHTVPAEHCNSERPEKLPGKKTDRTRIVWIPKSQQPDNEYFDNITTCLALAIREGIEMKASYTKGVENTKQEKGMDMAAYMAQQTNLL